MRYVTQTYQNRVTKGEKPEVYITVRTHYGLRVYAGETLSDDFDVPTVTYGSGAVYGGGLRYGVGSLVISKEPRVLSYGRLQRTLSPANKNLYAGMTSKRQGSFTVKLNNADREITRIMATEPFITRPLQATLGFEADPASEHLLLWEGVVDIITVDRESVTLTAVEA